MSEFKRKYINDKTFLVNYSNDMMRTGQVGEYHSTSRDTSPNAGGFGFIDNTANVKGKLSNQNDILR